MTTSTTSPALANGLAALAFARYVTDKEINGIPADKVCFQPCAGGNHLLWQVGHLATTDNWFLSTLSDADSACPDEWNELFGMGSVPVDDPSKYPPLDELVASMNERREKLIAWFSGMSDDDLAKELPDDLKGFAANFGVLMSNLAAHEALHGGQISVIRKALGLEKALG